MVLLSYVVLARSMCTGISDEEMNASSVSSLQYFLMVGMRPIRGGYRISKRGWEMVSGYLLCTKAPAY